MKTTTIKTTTMKTGTRLTTPAARPAAAALAVMPLAAAVAVLLLPGAPAQAATCGHVTGPFHQAKAQIFAADGSLYVPLGITVSGLERPTWADFAAADAAEIAAAPSWCANTVRLQVSQQRWASDGQPYRDQVRAEIAQAEDLGMAVVINDNNEWDTAAAPMPTVTTEAFWASIAALYKTDPQVVFDIFNEPRSHPGWACWHDGGQACVTAKGWHGIVGMSPLAKYVRSLAPNLMWIDGPGTQLDQATRTGIPEDTAATTLSTVRQWPIWGVRPMMYSIHHPAGPRTAANWSHQFGWLAEQRYSPVVDGEWTNFAADRSECWPDAPQRVPAYLAYLERLHVGMTVWKLGPWDQPGTEDGVLTTTDPRVPTGFGVWAHWRCVNGYHHSAGKRIHAWYANLNSS
jgi:Cellulase (glycosyl hydrolase family 5)